MKLPASEGEVLRPRCFVFAYKTNWKKIDTINNAFLEVVEPIDDKHRPNGVCIIDKCLIRRVPYKLETRIYENDPFLNFFIYVAFNSNHARVACKPREVL